MRSHALLRGFLTDIKPLNSHYEAHDLPMVPQLPCPENALKKLEDLRFYNFSDVADCLETMEFGFGRSCIISNIAPGHNLWRTYAMAVDKTF